MGKKHLSPAEKQQIVKDYQSGTPVNAIAQSYDIGKSTVFKIVQYTDKTDRKKRYAMPFIRSFLKSYREGGDMKKLTDKHGISVSTGYLWAQKYKDLDLSATAYSRQFKRNVINSLSDGHSKYEVSAKYGIALKLINEFLEEHKNGELDAPQMALKTITPPPAPTIKEASTVALDDFCDVLKLLVSKGLSVDDAADTAKAVITKFK